MKKVLLLLAITLVPILASAQNRLTLSAEISTGVGVVDTDFKTGIGVVDREAIISITPEFVAQYNLDSHWRVGAGLGVRLSSSYGLNYFPRSNEHIEMDMPLFLRVGYNLGNIYASVDAGYTLGLVARYGLGMLPGGWDDCDYDGLFIEPQIGWRIDAHNSVALGLLLQQSTIQKSTTTENGTKGSPGYSVSFKSEQVTLFVPAVSLRYAYHF